MGTSFEERLNFFKKIVSASLESMLAREHPQSLYEPIRYTLQGGGKRLRPILLLLATEAVGGDYRTALPAATAVELLHNFTLIHDDIMDEDDTRRGRPTVHAKWDDAVALLAGDGLVALAYKSLLETETGQLAEISRLFTDGILELCEGQALDREFETQARVTMPQYLEMITKKTARLLSMCVQIGAMIGNGTDDQVQAFAEYGTNLGIAFQIQDDLLDITVEQAVLGKNFGSDIQQKKKTYLLVDALEHGNAALRQDLDDYLAQDSIDHATTLQVQQLFTAAGTLDRTRQAVRRYIRKAKASLQRLEPHSETAYLDQLLEFVLKRNA